MKPTSIFITYNPNENEEQTLAIRLHSIGAVNGFRIYLPDRFNSDKIIDSTTQARIDGSDYVVLFAMSAKISDIVRQEIEYAYQRLHDKSKIIIIYGAKQSKKVNLIDHATEIYYTPHEESTDQVIKRIFDVIFKKHQEDLAAAYQKAKTAKLTEEIKKLKAETTQQNALIAFLGVGLGLALLALLGRD
jgi:hypothetical protein